MYCINCGVKLADTENKCPLCGTVPYHPDIQRGSAEKPYPIKEYPKSKKTVPIKNITFLLIHLSRIDTMITAHSKALTNQSGEPSVGKKNCFMKKLNE